MIPGERERSSPLQDNTAFTILPRCDFCRKVAFYDGKTGMGIWAYMCEEHFKLYGTGIGPGKGRVLALVDPGSELVTEPGRPFAVAGQVGALLHKCGKSRDAYEFASQLFQCEDSESVLAVLRQYVRMKDLSPATQTGEACIEVHTGNPMNC